MGRSVDARQSHADFQLRAYPNPINRSVRLQFDLPASGDITLRIFSLAGRAIHAQSLSMRAGTRRVTWTPDPTLSSGMYWAVVHYPATGQRCEPAKIVYMK
ncbi:T9SS type A sorting domain-containing protein [bacterium]|nr:T9SS type A sorting domain-containing protein [bacterium]